MLLHIVLIKRKPNVAADGIGGFSRVLASLPRLIPGIAGYHWGANVSPEGIGRGYEYGFVMTFEDAAARDAYLPHPEHAAIRPFMDAVAAEVLVFDIEA